MKINYNPKYAQKHISIRVPWHDNAWNGTICTNPKNNDACLALKNCAKNRKDDDEMAIAGIKIGDITDEEKLPPCISESALFMADYDLIKNIKHPYRNNPYYQHLQPTPVLFPKYSAPAIPFRWGIPENAHDFACEFDLDYGNDREPFAKTNNQKLSFTTKWVQDYNNQKAMFDGFFEQIKPNDSLSFFYAKEVPFIEENNRVLIGLGVVDSIIQSKPFDVSETKEFISMPWEHMVNHSIRPDNKNGFLFPYHEAIAYQKENPSFDPKSIAVIIPNEFRLEFSYKTEHVSHDYALYIIRESIKKIELAKSLGIGKDWDTILNWLSEKLLKVKELRGDYPGFGVALSVFGFERGYFLAQHIFNTIDKTECPWEYLNIIINTRNLIPLDLNRSIYDENIELWKSFQNNQKERLDLLQLISRFNLNLKQASFIFDTIERKRKYQNRTDKELLENPYLIYEISINSIEPINYAVIDSGLMLNNTKELLPKQTNQFHKLSKERIRSLTVMELETQASYGHTLFPEEKLITNIASLPIEPECNLTADYFNIATSIFHDVIVTQYTSDNKKAYQLYRFDNVAELINKKISKRLKGRRHKLQLNWVDYLGDINFKNTEADRKAKIEKIKALEEMANARFSILIGQAGSGKTTLLAALASIPKIEDGQVLFLAPTGKARVRMEEKAKELEVTVTAKTIASFLIKSNRFKGSTQTYQLNDNKNTERGFKTVIIDECSMLTEEMLAATLQHLESVQRLILVGDYRQLPPIGAGRPFFDIINYIKPKNIENEFPKIANSYIELTASARQEEVEGTRRLDKEFASLFGGNLIENNADEIFEKVIAGESDHIKIYNWKNETDFEDVLKQALDVELGIVDEESFNNSIGAQDGFFNFDFNGVKSVDKIEDWQLLSPVRSRVFGTNQLNRSLHLNYKKKALSYAKNNKIFNTPKPFGNEEVIYGDKIINLVNHKHESNNWPKENTLEYIANGEMGIVIGRFNRNTKKNKKKPWVLDIEFSSQKGNKFEFNKKYFSEENGNQIELAYALTIHKAQGSQFKTVILVVPEPCNLLSRELIYTALTRQVEKVILLFQGHPQTLYNYTNDFHSASLQRITNLFYKPNITKLNNIMFEKNLIHCASDGKLLRSKSEVIIYELLLKSNLKPEYEYELKIDNQIKRPDFYIEDDDSGEIYYWEHLGMLNDKNYAKKWEKKLTWYKSKDILPYEDGGGENGCLIITKDDFNGGISVKEIADLINEIFDIRSKPKTVSEIESLTLIVNELRKSIETQFSILTTSFNEIKKASLKSDEKIESIYGILDKESDLNILDNYYLRIKDEFNNYDVLEDNSKKFLASAYFLYDRFEKSNIDDFSPFILQFSRTIEYEFLNKLFLSFYPILNLLLEDNETFIEDENNNPKTKIFAKSLNKRSEKFTLGTMVFILGYIYNPNGSTLNSSNLLKKFRNHILTIVSHDILNKEFINSLDTLTKDYRNKAAHIENISKMKADDFLILGKKIINKFTNSLIC